MNITDISGIGDATAQRLRTHGIDSVEAVAQASIEQLVAVPGIGPDRAAALRLSANRLLPDTAVAEGADAVTGAEEEDDLPRPAGDEAKRRKDRKERKHKKKGKKRQKVKDNKEKKKKNKKKEKKEAKRRKKGKNKRK